MKESVSTKARVTASEILAIALFAIIGAALFSVPGTITRRNLQQRENQEKDLGRNIRTEKEESPKERQKYSLERYQYLFRMLRDPKTGKIPDNVRARELAYAHLIDQENRFLTPNRSIAAASGFSYSQAGPYDIGGRTRALGITMNSSNQPDIYIAGGVSGGIWKSTDAGATWQLKTSPGQSMSVTSLAQDPVNPNVWYYCGGEFVGNSTSIEGAPYRGSGVFKSTDNGDTWNVLPITQIQDQASYHSVFQYCSKIVVSPTTESLFICSNAGIILRSTDGGNSFQKVLGGINNHYFTNIAVASNGTLIAALSEYGYQSSAQSPPGIYLSTDDGNTWNNITPASFPLTYERTVLAFAPSDPTVAYSLTYTGSKVNGHDDMRFFKYTISGSTATSEDRSSNLPEFGGSVGDFNQGDYNMVVAVKPDDPNFVLLGSTNLYRSFDGFSTPANDKSKNWIGGYSTKNDISTYPGNHPDQHIIAFVPDNPNELVDGHDGGLSFTSDITKQGTGDAVTWTSLNNKYITSQFYTIAMSDSSNDTRLLGGTQDNGSPYFRASSATSTISSDISSGDGGDAYLGKNFAYASTQNGSVVRYLYTSSGDVAQIGQTDVDPQNAKNQLFITPYTVDPNSENVMYYAAGSLLWRNANISSGTPRNFWEEVPVLNAVDTVKNITALAVTRELPTHTLYMGVSGGNQDSAKVYRLDNAPMATTASDISSPDFPVGGYISDIAVNPKNGNEFIVVFSNYNVSSLFYTDNGGQSYSQVQGNLQGNLNNNNEYIGPSVRSAAIVNTGDGKYFFAGTSVGLYMTTALSDTATKWVKQAPDIIGDAVVSSLYSRPADGWVAVGTHGRGVFLGKPEVAPSGGSNPGTTLPSEVSLQQNYPNPFNPSTKIPFKLGQQARVTLQIYDLTGRLVSTLIDNASYYAGEYDVLFQPYQLASGTYFYRLTAVTKDKRLTQVRKMVYIR